METDVVELIKQYGVGSLALVITLYVGIRGYVRLKLQENDLNKLDDALTEHLVECSKSNTDIVNLIKEERKELKADRGKLHDRIDELSKDVNKLIGKLEK